MTRCESLEIGGLGLEIIPFVILRFVIPRSLSFAISRHILLRIIEDRMVVSLLPFVILRHILLRLLEDRMFVSFF